MFGVTKLMSQLKQKPWTVRPGTVRTKVWRQTSAPPNIALIEWNHNVSERQTLFSLFEHCKRSCILEVLRVGFSCICTSAIIACDLAGVPASQPDMCRCLYLHNTRKLCHYLVILV